MQLWQIGFGLLNRPVPYYAAEDLHEQLTRRGLAFTTTPVPYELRFSDSPENRLKILRFLFGDHLPAISADRLLPEFDRYKHDADILISTFSEHLVVQTEIPQPSPGRDQTS